MNGDVAQESVKHAHRTGWTLVALTAAALALAACSGDRIFGDHTTLMGGDTTASIAPSTVESEVAPPTAAQAVRDSGRTVRTLPRTSPLWHGVPRE